MQAPFDWIWQRPEWTGVRRDDGRRAPLLSRARLAQGEVLGAARLLASSLTLGAVATILVENGLTLSAIKGERLDLHAVRCSVAR